jgi:hypothetical protein
MFRISQLDWPRILFTRRAAILLGLAAALSGCGLAIIHSDVNIEALDPLERDVLSIAGAVGAFGIVFLFVCMGFFWFRCDISTRLSRTVWFVLLLLGWAYGSQIMYYALVYLPAVIKRLRIPERETHVIETHQLAGDRRSIGPFGWILIAGWALLFLTVAAFFAFPKPMSQIFRPVADFFVLWPASLLVGTGAYAIILIFRAGMKRQ